MSLTKLLAVVRAALIKGVYERLWADGHVSLRPAHGWALFAVGTTGTTTAHLSRDLGMTRQGAARVVDSLLQHGYLERLDHPNDGRSNLIVRTERGNSAFELHQRTLRELESEWGEMLGASAAHELRSSLERLAEEYYGDDVPSERPRW